MKKAILVVVLVAGGLMINACTEETTDEQTLEILSPDGNETEDPDNRGHN